METECKPKTTGIISRVTVDLVYTGIPRLPHPGEELLSAGFALAPGGGAIVTVVALQRLGMPVKAGLYMGHGLEGELAAMLLKKQGLGSYQPLPAGGCQPVVFSSVMSYGGDRSIVTYDEAPPPMSDDDTLAFYAGCDIAVLPDADAPVARLRAPGRLLVCDPNMPALERIPPLLPLLDIVTPNQAEAAKLSGCSNPREALAWLAAAGVRNPVVKLGAGGCLGWIDGQAVHLKAAEPFEPVDSTGAGDNFVAGMLYGLAKGWPLARCLRMGNIFGGVSTTAVGAFGPALTESEVLALEKKIYGGPQG